MYTMGTETAPPSRDWCVDQMSTIEQFVERLVYSKVKVKLLSRVRLFATPWTVAYEAPPSMEFSRQEYWSGLSFPSPGDLPHPRIEPGSPSLQADALTIWATREAPSIYCCCCWVTSVCPTLCDPIDGSPPGSPVPGILQARTLEWIAISFSSAWKWKVKVKSLSRVRLFATPRTAAHQAPPSMGFSRQEYWGGCHCLLRRHRPKAQ